MWIKEIIIEGFKSYATRTVITNLDQEFNAITGLNGSGKSNILDAILFCLGLSKEYEIVRIKKLQELIYKNGAAGITKAEVTIIFDNRDKQNSPLGYQESDKITVTRQITSEKTKYFINGHSETQKNFKNMFRSVQINIDNPHFLVAQGRITKIINLKPQELIGMLEETAGTALYNEKKREAQKLMTKKEEKLKQVNEIIDTEIKPQMQKLIDERELYKLWRAQETEIQRLQSQIYSYDYYKKMQGYKQKKIEHQQLNDSITQLQDKAHKEEIEIKLIMEAIEKKQVDNKSQQYQQVEAKVKELQAIVNKQDKELTVSKKTKETVDNERIKLEHMVKTLEAEIERIQSKREISDKTLNQMKQELQERKDLLEEQTRQKQQAGTTTVEDANQMIQKQVRDTEAYIHSHKRDLDQIDDRLVRIKDKMESSRKLFDNSQKDSANVEQKLAILKKEIDGLEKELEGNMGLDNEIQLIKQQRIEIDQNILEIKNKLSEQPTYYFLNLNRMTNWDRNRVYGKIFSLFEVKEDSFMKSLELGAGPKLQNIVVDDSNTAAHMLKNNILNHHAYIIPNKEINYSEVHEEYVKAAAHIASDMGGFAKPAIDFIKYSNQFDRAMRFVFGNFIIASTMEIANKVAYHHTNRQKFKVVTKDGDVVDPSGTITGGYVNEKNQLLPRYKYIHKLNQDLKEETRKLEELENKMKSKQQDSKFHEQVRQDLQDKKYQIEQLNQKQKRSSNFNYQTEQQKLQNEEQDLKVEQGRLQQLIKSTENKLKDLVQDSKQMQKGKDAGALLQQQIDRTKKEIEKLKQNIDQYKQEVQGLEVDMENHQSETVKCQKKIAEENQNLEQLQNKLGKLEKESLHFKDQLQRLTEQKNDLESKNAIFMNAIKNLNENLIEHQKYLQQSNEQLQGQNAEQKKLDRELHDLMASSKHLEDTYEFIRLNKHELTQDQLPSKFSHLQEFDYEQTKIQFQKLEHDQGKLGKTVNFKVEAMTEQVEKEFRQLVEKKSILESDKVMLYQNMGELDDKKIKTIEKCFLEVNKHFSSIFGSLLSNAQARLGRLDGQSIEEGIEMTVSFSHQQKNLSELSGGQRSLLALSFILALLKYKPAPFYILDEVDSALDLSHTENIGHMIAQNFKESQFILISLKEGMYQNANVLYKVQFIDGISKVDRYAIKDQQNKKKQKIQ